MKTKLFFLLLFVCYITNNFAQDVTTTFNYPNWCESKQFNQRATLYQAEGVAISPQKTYFSYAGETKTFTLYFPAIPRGTTSIDFIESSDSSWKLYGIQLK